MTRNVHTKRLSSGKYIDLGNLTTDDIDLNDINRALNYIYRFTGHFKDKEPLTVAQHLKLSDRIRSMIYPDDYVLELDVKIHDFPEAYTGDIATPLKYLFGPQFKDYEHGVERVVYDKLWVINTPFTYEIYENRKVCDLLALDIERRNIWADQKGKDQWPAIPLPTLFSQKERKELFDWAQSERHVNLIRMYDEAIEKNVND